MFYHHSLPSMCNQLFSIPQSKWLNDLTIGLTYGLVSGAILYQGSHIKDSWFGSWPRMLGHHFESFIGSEILEFRIQALISYPILICLIENFLCLWYISLGSDLISWTSSPVAFVTRLVKSDTSKSSSLLLSLQLLSFRSK